MWESCLGIFTKDNPVTMLNDLCGWKKDPIPNSPDVINHC